VLSLEFSKIALCFAMALNLTLKVKRIARGIVYIYPTQPPLRGEELID
jgi:hypothetical protein